MKIVKDKKLEAKVNELDQTFDTNEVLAEVKANRWSLEGRKGGTPTWLPDEGVYAARVMAVVDIGEQTQTYNGETSTKDMLTILFRLNAKDDSGNYFIVNKRVTFNFSPKSNLFKIAEKALGEAKAKELSDVADLLGAPVGVEIKHNNSGERTYANIDNVFMGKEADAPSADGWVIPNYWTETYGEDAYVTL